MSDEVKPNRTLRELYTLIGDIELVHVMSGAKSVKVEMLIDGAATARTLALPAGNYLLIKVIDQPTPRRGLFGVVAAKP